MRIRRAAVAFLAASVVSSAAGVARAQPSPPPTAAEQTFSEGLALYDAGKIAPACRKFEESFTLDPANGTLQNLAACHEAEGKRALALAEWSDLLVRATRAGQRPREMLARQHMTALAAVLPRLKLRNAATSNVRSITIDGVPVDTNAWSAPIAVDPGAHAIAFAAPGFRTVTTKLNVVDPVLLELEVPTLDALPADAPPAAGPAAAEPTDRTVPVEPAARVEPAPVSAEAPKARQTSTLGWAVSGGGLALIGAGTVFGVLALDKRSDSDAECPGGRCTQRGVDLNDEAIRNAWIANVGIGLGVVAIGVGLYLVLTSAPPVARSAVRMAPRGLELTF